jgi:Uncharacterized protein conserved in bacteria (DUF2330)
MNRLAGIAIGAAALLAYEHEAHACGGCFHQPSEVETVVTGHRMAFSTSPLQSVLWDQIQYSGNPADFAWVLPVTPGAVIQLSQDAWMAALEAATAPVVTGPTPNCPVQAGGGGGCGSSASGGGGAFGSDVPGSGGVTVVSQQVIGPYDAVTVRSSQGEALDTWLNANGYIVSPQMAPVLMAYANEGMDFIALKLRPGEGVQAMKPVRVVTQGADVTLPLRMVAAGAGANIAIELFVLSGGRYAPQNFPQASIDFSKLAWDPSLNDSNFTTLTQAALAAGAGDGWITEFSGPLNLDQLGGNNPGLYATYASLCATQDSGSSAVPIVDASDDADDGGETDAAQSDSGLVPPAYYASCDDLSVAEYGLGGGVWVTRLRANLPVGALANDLVLGAAASQLPVSNLHTTEVYTDPTYDPCSNGAAGGSSLGSGCACETSGGRSDGGAWLLSGLTALGLSALLKRRRR